VGLELEGLEVAENSEDKWAGLMRVLVGRAEL
jgi:hypothetical protein